MQVLLPTCPCARGVQAAAWRGCATTATSFCFRHGQCLHIRAEKGSNRANELCNLLLRGFSTSSFSAFSSHRLPTVGQKPLQDWSCSALTSGSSIMPLHLLSSCTSAYPRLLSMMEQPRIHWMTFQPPPLGNVLNQKDFYFFCPQKNTSPARKGTWDTPDSHCVLPVGSQQPPSTAQHFKKSIWGKSYSRKELPFPRPRL